MIARRPLMVLLIVALSLSATALIQGRLNGLRERVFDEELLYLPNEKLLNHFTAGASNVIADLLWIQCLQYTATHFRGDYKFTWLAHMCDVITQLDPYFVDAYRYGGIFLAALKADDEASITLLKRGYLNNPDSWELPYEIAMVYLLNRRDQPGSQEEGAFYLSVATLTGHPPKYVLDFAANLQTIHNMFDLERRMWTELSESEDEFMRKLAVRKLDEVDIRQTCSQLNDAVELFTQDLARKPATLDELTARGYIATAPEDVFGGQYFIDQNGIAQNTTILDNIKSTILQHMERAIEVYHHQYQQWPERLENIVEAGLLPSIAPHPYAGQEWTYQPTTGNVH